MLGLGALKDLQGYFPTAFGSMKEGASQATSDAFPVYLDPSVSSTVLYSEDGKNIGVFSDPKKVIGYAYSIKRVNLAVYNLYIHTGSRVVVVWANNVTTKPQTTQTVTNPPNIDKQTVENGLNRLIAIDEANYNLFIPMALAVYKAGLQGKNVTAVQKTLELIANDWYARQLKLDEYKNAGYMTGSTGISTITDKASTWLQKIWDIPTATLLTNPGLLFGLGFLPLLGRIAAKRVLPWIGAVIIGTIGFTALKNVYNWVFGKNTGIERALSNKADLEKALPFVKNLLNPQQQAELLTYVNDREKAAYMLGNKDGKDSKIGKVFGKVALALGTATALLYVSKKQK